MIQTGKRLWHEKKEYVVEYVLLTVILLFGMAYFSYSAWKHCSYGCNDEYTHHEWIRGLQQGKIFVKGIYPEGMHCFIYCLKELFGIRLYSCILFLAGIHIMTFLTAAYCLLREVYAVRYTPLLVLIAYLTIDGMGWGTALEAMSRLTWTLPQEFGMYLVFLCPLLLLRFFRSGDHGFRRIPWYKEEDLILLMLGVCGAVSVHFYVLIMAFFGCLAVVFVYWKKMLSVKRLFSLSGAAVCGMVLGVLPMAAAYFMGKTLDGSMYWGMSLISNTNQGTVSDPAAKEHIRTLVSHMFRNIFDYGYAAVYGKENAVRILVISVMMIVLSCCCSLRAYGRKQNGVRPLLPNLSSGYSFLILFSVVFVILYAAPHMDLPELVCAERLVSINKMAAFGVAAMPVDFVFFLAGHSHRTGTLKKGAVLGCMIIGIFSALFDYHEYLYWSLKRYDAAVFVTNEIMNRFSAQSCRIISMGDEAYQLEDEEEHEELLEFALHIKQDEYYLQNEYLFFYVEKHPLLRGQTHFITGPGWLADPSSQFYEDPAVSLCPDVIHTEISKEMADREVLYKRSCFESYNDMEIRTVLSSKLYEWCLDFAKRHPQETEVYYEDEDFVCYAVHQDPDSLLNLAWNGTLQKE